MEFKEKTAGMEKKIAKKGSILAMSIRPNYNERTVA